MRAERTYGPTRPWDRDPPPPASNPLILRSPGGVHTCIIGAMPVNRRKFVLAALAAAWVWFVAAPAGACDVPVFRYALERWSPGSYDVVILYHGPLAAEDKKLADELSKQAADMQAPCNLDVRLVDVDAGQADQDIEPLRKSATTQPLPRIVLCYPRRMAGPPVAAWSGPLTGGNVGAMLDSPARREVVKRIAAGESVVWVMLEGGKKAKDDAAAQLLTAELNRLQTTLKLPEPGQDSTGLPDAPPPDGSRPALKLAFSLVRVCRTAPGEHVLVDMLTHTEEDLSRQFADEPMAFGIFGQGRAMFALVGKGINKENIEELCGFLTGRCSCEVKDRNPGTDLLIAADWSAVRQQQPELPAVSVALPAAIAAPPGPETASASMPAPQAGLLTSGPSPLSPLLRNILIALGAMAVAAVGLVLWLNHRTARSET